MEFNIAKVCRICLQDGVYDILTSIFVDDDYSTHISDKIMACAAVEVRQGDGLPALICNKCADKVNTAYQFKQECESADHMLRELIEKRTKAHILKINDRSSENLNITKFQEVNEREVNILLKLETLNTDLGDEMEIANNETVGNDDFESSHDSIEEQFIDTITDAASVSYEFSIEHDVFGENNAIIEEVAETITDELVQPDEYDSFLDMKLEQPLKRRTRRLPKKLASDNEEENLPIRKKAVKIKCRVCAVSMSSNSMSMHMRKVHNEQAVFCKICHKQFSEKTGLAGHMKSHAKTKLCCQVCEAVFFTPAKLYIHMQRIHHNIEQQAVILGSIEQDLLAINTKKSKPRFICEVCGKSLPSPSRLDIHMRSHTKEKPFACGLCTKSFTESGGLNKHALTHSGRKDFICDVCEKAFSSRAARKNHTLIHTGELPFPCVVCIRKFRTKQCLEEHVRRAHTFEKPFICDICEKSFISSNQLILHRRIHTGERPYQCNVCQLTFRTQDAAKIHLRRHLGEKKFVCDVCNMGFVSTGELKRHQLRHTGVKKFECSVCGRKFARGDKLLYHINRLHN